MQIKMRVEGRTTASPPALDRSNVVQSRLHGGMLHEILFAGFMALGSSSMDARHEFKERMGRHIPPVRRLLDQRDALRQQLADQTVELDKLGALAWPPGHYYSPLPSLEDVRSRSAQIFDAPDGLPEIDPEPESQMTLVRSLSHFAHEMTFPDRSSEDYRYYFENDFFSYGDAIAFHCILRFLKPSRVVEIGSGFSSALILDTNDRNLGGRMQCTFVEPYPDRLMDLLNGDDRDRVTILRSPLQDVAEDIIGSLGANDVLFIDSSHVSKIGSDVNLLIFQILPKLPKGVFVHFHDIFYPFEYPAEWVYKGWWWSEAYLLRAYLQANRGYRIRWWNSYLARFHHDEVAQALPKWGRGTGCSIWLERL